MHSQIKRLERIQNAVVFYASFTIIMALLLVTVSSQKQQQLLGLPSAHAQGFVFPVERSTISVVGEAEKKIMPDEIEVSLAVENIEVDANQARKNNAEKMEKIVASLKNNGLNNENISTSNFEIRPNFDTANNNFDKIVSYTALNKIRLTTSSSANISSFIDSAVNSGANRVDSIEFTSSKEALNEYFKELLKEAFNDAIQKVDILSKEGNFIINGVKNIDLAQNNGYNPPIPYYALDQERMSSATEKSDATPTQIIPQENTLSVTIPITFFIENINGNGNRSENQTQ